MKTKSGMKIASWDENYIRDENSILGQSSALMMIQIAAT